MMYSTRFDCWEDYLDYLADTCEEEDEDYIPPIVDVSYIFDTIKI